MASPRYLQPGRHGRDITKIDDPASDPGFKGKVSLLRHSDGPACSCCRNGDSPAENPTLETIQKAVDRPSGQKDKGQIRRFTGNDYATTWPPATSVVAQPIRVTCS